MTIRVGGRKLSTNYIAFPEHSWAKIDIFRTWIWISMNTQKLIFPLFASKIFSMDYLYYGISLWIIHYLGDANYCCFCSNMDMTRIWWSAHKSKRQIFELEVVVEMRSQRSVWYVVVTHSAQFGLDGFAVIVDDFEATELMIFINWNWLFGW